MAGVVQISLQVALKGPGIGTFDSMVWCGQGTSFHGMPRHIDSFHNMIPGAMTAGHGNKFFSEALTDFTSVVVVGSISCWNVSMVQYELLSSYIYSIIYARTMVIIVSSCYFFVKVDIFVYIRC